MAKPLKEWREERNLSLRALAERSGVHFTSISEIEQGNRRPHAQTAAKLARALGVRLFQIEEFYIRDREELPEEEFELLASPPAAVHEPGVKYQDLHADMLRLLRDMTVYLVLAGHREDVEQMLREVLEDTEGDQK